MKILQFPLITFLLAFALATNPSSLMDNPCQPFGLRIALGQTIYNTNSPEILSIWFNTPETCSKSFINLEKSSTEIQKVYCDTWETGMSKYKTFIHRCSITSLEKGSEFTYMAYGWTGTSSDPGVPFGTEKIKSHIPKGDSNFKMLVLADWSYLEQKRDQYTPLDNSFEEIIQSNMTIDALFINGDVAYDLDSNNGHNY